MNGYRNISNRFDFVVMIGLNPLTETEQYLSAEERRVRARAAASLAACAAAVAWESDEKRERERER